MAAQESAFKAFMRNEKVVRVGLATVAIVAVALAVYGVLAGRGDPLDKPLEVRFRCLDCGHEWAPSPEEVEAHPGMLLGSHIKCPECGKARGARMTKCPSCGRWYVQERMKYPKRDYSPDMKNICPHCHTDVNQWQREHRPKQEQ